MQVQLWIIVFSISFAIFFRSVSTNLITYSDSVAGSWWSNEQVVDGGWGPIFMLGCRGDNCDELQKKYIKLTLGASSIGAKSTVAGGAYLTERTWLPYAPVTTTHQPSTTGCPAPKFVVDIRCKGSLCETVQIECAGAFFPNAPIYMANCEWVANSTCTSNCNGLTSSVTPRYCPAGRILQGLQCRGTKCSIMNLKCCAIKAATCNPGYYSNSCLKCPGCNNGICSDGVSGNGTCICNPGWKGKFCNEDIAECLIPGYCPPKSTCSDPVPGNFAICTCDPGLQFVVVNNLKYCPRIINVITLNPTIGGESFTIYWNTTSTVHNAKFFFEVVAFSSSLNQMSVITSDFNCTFKNNANFNIRSNERYFYKVRIINSTADPTLEYMDTAYSPTNNLTTNCHCDEISDVVESENGFDVLDVMRYPIPSQASFNQTFTNIIGSFRDTSTCEIAVDVQISDGNFNRLSGTPPGCNLPGSFPVINGLDTYPEIGIPFSVKFYYIYSPGLLRLGPSTMQFTVSWIAQFKIQIFTPSGGIVRGVSVTIFAGNSSFSGISDETGSVLILAQLPGNYDHANVVSVQISKIVNNIDHVFSQQGSSVPLSNNTYNFGTINHKSSIVQNFVDNSVIRISGHILFSPNSMCGSPGARICAGGDCVISDSDGFYTVTVSVDTEVTVTAQLESHNITPTTNNIVNSPSDVVLNFTDWTRRTLNVTTAGGLCEFHIGSSEIILQPKNCQLAQDDPLNGIQSVDKFRQFELFPIVYEVSLQKFTELDDTIFGSSTNFFKASETVSVNLTDSDESIKWIYRSVPTVTIFGFSIYKPNCQSENLDAILRQRDSPYPLYLQFSENYTSQSNIMVCGNAVVDVRISDGISDYDCLPNDPCIKQPIFNQTEFSSTLVYEILAKTPNTEISPYTKSVTFSITRAGDPTVKIHRTVTVLITGANLIGDKYTTNLPAGTIPLLVLRKPPGGNSYSFFEKSSSVTQKIAVTSENSKENSFNSKIWLGFKDSTDACIGFIGGICTSITDISIQAGGTVDLETLANTFSSNEWSFDVSFSESIETSANSEIIGNEGDIIFSPSILLVYSRAKVIQFNMISCEPVITEKVTFYPVTDHVNSVNAFYTVNDIQWEISKLTTFLESTEISGYNATLLEIQLQNWIQILEVYFNTTRDAITASNSGNSSDMEDKIITFSGGGQSLTYSSSYTNAQSRSIEVTTEISSQIGAFLESDVTISKVTVGADISYFQRLSLTIGSSSTTDSTSTTTVGYSLGDPDVGDSFSVRVLKDPIYATPIFVLQGGESSCPSEPGTNPREKAIISVARPNRLDTPISTDSAEIFNVSFKNVGTKSSTFIFDVNPASLNGLSLKLNNDDSFTARKFQLNPNGEAQIFLVARKGILPVYEYKNVEISFTSDCDSSVTVSELLSVKFLQPCPTPVWTGKFDELQKTGGKWFLNSNSNTMEIATKNVDYPVDSWLSNSRLLEIAVQLCTESTCTWSKLGNVNFKNLEDSLGHSTSSIDFTEIPDGNYCLRLFSTCTLSAFTTLDTSASLPICGVIDRSPPIRFGIPNPINKIWNIGDEISVSFNEPIMCSGLPIIHTDAKIVGTNESVGLLQVCEQRTRSFQFTPQYLFDNLVKKELEITLRVSDLAGNVAQNSEVISFSVSDIDLSQVTVVLKGLQIVNHTESEDTSAIISEIISELTEVFGADNVEFEITEPVLSSDTFTFSLKISYKHLSKKRGTTITSTTLAYQIAKYQSEQKFSNLSVLSRLSVSPTVALDLISSEIAAGGKLFVEFLLLLVLLCYHFFI